jgi:hypothetical protein
MAVIICLENQELLNVLRLKNLLGFSLSGNVQILSLILCSINRQKISFVTPKMA